MESTPSSSAAEAPVATTPFEWIGGEERVRALTERFYDLMDLEPGYAQLRAAHGSDLRQARQKLFIFLCGAGVRATCRLPSVSKSATSG